jgi:hypothetical protein
MSHKWKKTEVHHHGIGPIKAWVCSKCGCESMMNNKPPANIMVVYDGDYALASDMEWPGKLFLTCEEFVVQRIQED